MKRYWIMVLFWVAVFLWFAERSNRADSVTYLNGIIHATNFILDSPRWVDEKFAGISFGANPSADPPARTEVAGGTGIYGLGFSADDNGDFQIQTQHGLTTTNSRFPDLWFNPHIHVTATTVGSGANSGWILRYQVALVNGSWSSVVYKTNGVTFSGANVHQILGFGPITNNALQGANSVLFRGNLQCQSNNTGGPVILESLDWHIPVNQYGSTDEY